MRRIWENLAFVSSANIFDGGVAIGNIYRIGSEHVNVIYAQQERPVFPDHRSAQREPLRLQGSEQFVVVDRIKSSGGEVPDLRWNYTHTKARTGYRSICKNLDGLPRACHFIAAQFQIELVVVPKTLGDARNEGFDVDFGGERVLPDISTGDRRGLRPLRRKPQEALFCFYRLLRDQCELAQVMIIERALSVGGLIKSECAGYFDFERTGVDKAVDLV